MTIIDRIDFDTGQVITIQLTGEVLPSGTPEMLVVVQENPKDYLPAKKLEPNNNKRRRILAANPWIRTMPAQSLRTWRLIPNRPLIHTGDWLKHLLSKNATIDPQDLPGYDVDRLLADIQEQDRMKAEIRASNCPG